jgi:hypothetical protein
MSAVKDEYSLMQAGGWTSRAAVSRYQHKTEERRRANLQVGGKIAIPPPALPQDAGESDGGENGSSTTTSP